MFSWRVRGLFWALTVFEAEDGMMPSTPKHLVWFRSDLRTADQMALRSAAAGREGVVGLYVLSPADWLRHDMAPARVEFLLRSLECLSQDLRAFNIPLLVRTAADWRDVPGVVLGVMREVGCEDLHVNREYEIHEAQRDEQTGSLVRAAGLRMSSYHDQTILPPGEVLTQTGGPYTVFSPFKRAWFAVLLNQGGLRVAGLPARQPENPLASDPIPTAIAGFASAVPAELWPGGEAEATRRLTAFVARGISRYKADRDRADLEGTSTLSPYLAIGAISPRTCLRAALDANGGQLDRGGVGEVHWISELVWREFYKHILVAFPRVCKGRAFKPESERLRWAENPAHLAAWQAGMTGFPIVDAAMRALSATGWMHNRLRMITAMFLTKDLFLDWRLGERHFMLNLVDGDLAQNNGGWQWSASTGTDAAPYFRIFNPASQSRKCDPEGRFIKRWVPELRDLDGEDIHDPAEWPALFRPRLDYPELIVDHAASRARVLAAFKALA